MQICKINKNNLRDALELVWEVFEKYEAPVYGEIGTKTFQHFIEYSNILTMINEGKMKLWGCYINGYLVGVSALRDGNHVSLLFVREKFHRLGVARRLIDVLVDFVAQDAKAYKAVTVNSSPYAVEFYEKCKFVKTADEQKADGISYTPMKRVI